MSIPIQFVDSCFVLLGVGYPIFNIRSFCNCWLYEMSEWQTIPMIDFVIRKKSYHDKLIGKAMLHKIELPQEASVKLIAIV